MDGCLSKTELQEGFIRCPDERVLLGSNGRINVHRLNNLSECNNIKFCNESTCFLSNVSACFDNECIDSHVICASYCDNEILCNGVFQCADSRLIFFSQFCDGFADCSDGSDEITNRPGFKCSKCILPQLNLFDEFAHCDDSSDLCFANESACFQCFDKRLIISSSQVCDGVDDCYDLSDECLCEGYFDTDLCKGVFEDKKFQCFSNEKLPQWHSLHKVFESNTTNLFKECSTKNNSLIFATKCNGRPECRDFSDECECAQPPNFCNDTCHNYFPMGDRYCDGVEDLAWRYINKSEYPQGFDERFRPKRFRCNANGKVSIDIIQVCDGKTDCDDNSDENNCPTESNFRSIFSSETEMIDNVAIKSAFWVIGFLVIIGNSYVIISTVVLQKDKPKRDGVRFQHFIILNISMADFVMGIYLLAIAFYDASFSGFYGNVDRKWRSGLSCSIVGSLAVISSETFCFLMVILTAFRLKNVTNPLGSLTSSLLPWKCGIIASWLLSLALSIFPWINFTSQYFLHSFSYTSSFQSGQWNISRLEQFVCRFAALINATIKFTGNSFQSVEAFVQNGSPINESINLFGYYGQTSVCMPRFYVGYGESSWEYTFAITTINFLSFLFIAVGYFFIYKYSSASSAGLRSSKADNQAAKMQKRIARIIATDFCCWIPICIMAYVRLGIGFSNIVYQISAVLLLPINSAMNPFLFSSLPDKLIDLCRHKTLKNS